MLFNSLTFLVFFPIVCTVYFILPTTKYRNLFLLGASYFFYMNWEPAYALLILTSTVITYGCGILVERNSTRSKKKAFLTISLILNLAILFLFKYYNFLGTSITAALHACGIAWQVPGLDILLPVGISFYTFQAIGYTIDVYRGTLRAERNFFTYALFVSFFPQLVAGPIERAKNLLPQFRDEHHAVDYDRIMAGLRMMLWGYFLKLCVADRCGIDVDMVFNNVEHYNGTSFIITAVLFTFQIYGDFAGYSLIAIGAAKVMGFRLMENFHRPYFSTTVGEFWKRWHISLSTWFMDYLYIPLGGNRVGRARHYFNLFVTFLVSGIWHGANWTFVAWGALHGIVLCIEKVIGISKRQFSGFSKLLHWGITFVIVCFAWILFRANNLDDAMTIISGIFTNIGRPKLDLANVMADGMALSLLFIVEFLQEYGKGRRLLHPSSWVVRHLQMAALIAFILLFGVLGSDQFIYFQF